MVEIMGQVSHIVIHHVNVYPGETLDLVHGTI